MNTRFYGSGRRINAGLWLWIIMSPGIVFAGNSPQINSPANGSTLTVEQVTIEWASVNNAVGYVLTVTPAGSNVSPQNFSSSVTSSPITVTLDGNPVTVGLQVNINGGRGGSSSQSTSATYATSVGVEEPCEFEAGCPPSEGDADGDGVADEFDQCAGTPIEEEVDTQGCSPSQLDSDGDGVNDAADICPNTTVGAVVDEQGCSTLDTDNDGVSDVHDDCPNTPDFEEVNEAGCSFSQLNTRPQTEIISPVSGSTISAGALQLIWERDSSAASFNLFVGSTPGGSDLAFQSLSGLTTTSTVTIPSTISNVYVTLQTNLFPGDQDVPPPPYSVSATYRMDADGDGVRDALDLCPNTPPGHVVDEQGCDLSANDTDNDGVNDTVDVCPGTPVGQTVDEQGCAASQIDTDDDGVVDTLDQCPDTPVGQTPDAAGCAPSQLDSDNDGINDELDQCPGTSAFDQVNYQGCSSSQLGLLFITGPASGDILTNTPTQFSWEWNGEPNRTFTLLVGSTPGSSNIQSRSNISSADRATSLTIPLDGSTVYVTLKTTVGYSDSDQGVTYYSTNMIYQTAIDIDGDGVLDGDGSSDGDDLCPDTDSGLPVNEQGCAANQLDTDNDGVNDALDQCPDTPIGESVDSNGCSSSGIDSDDDGILDADDAYPYQSATQCTP